MYNVTNTEQFEKDLRFYAKKQKCHKLIKEIRNLKCDLKNGIFHGTKINRIGLSKDEVCYKLRLEDKDRGIGKRGGFRIIYYCVTKDKEIFLLSVYSKKDRSNISSNRINDLIGNIVYRTSP
jgi:mRNA-degrading endonuclease RelE of RelBE toxin-antitoxin system